MKYFYKIFANSFWHMLYKNTETIECIIHALLEFNYKHTIYIVTYFELHKTFTIVSPFLHCTHLSLSLILR